jgi:2-amino-4-hydroxy-6-hydroxymethyldihydropteridine diphosphokinase
VSEKTTAFLGIGANLGDRAETLRLAVDRLDTHKQIDVVAVSSVYETGPVGVLDQPDFLNAVVQVETSLTAQALLGVLLETELFFGRRRLKKWGPRILDLDVLLFGEAVIDEPGLTVPHPYLHVRGFVLHPLCDLVAEEKHPVLGCSFASLLNDVDDGAVHRVAHLSLWA